MSTTSTRSSSTDSAATRSRAERSRTVHAGLTAHDVVDAALAIVERDGGRALTMRGLASELGVTTTTIYWHVGNRDELVIALIEALAARLGTAEVVGETPAERVTDAAMNIWRNALAHRNVTALAGQVQRGEVVPKRGGVAVGIGADGNHLRHRGSLFPRARR